MAGAWVNSDGHWHQSCWQMELRNYHLALKSGYFKSVQDMMYCDATFGPVLVRREFAQQYAELWQLRAGVEIEV